MSECTHNCSTCGENCSSRNTPQSLLEPVNSLSTVGKVYAVVSGKGGGGKSTVTSLLSVMTAKKGFKTAVLDADITGPSIPKMLGINERAMADDNGIYPGVSKSGVRAMSLNMLVEDETTPVIWRGPVIAGTVKQFWTDVIWGDIDCMYIDMPPGTGDIQLTLSQQVPLTGAVVVTTPQDIALIDAKKGLRMFQKVNVPILGIIENMSVFICPHCGEVEHIFGEGGAKRMSEQYGVPLLGELPLSAKIREQADSGLPTVAAEPDGKEALMYREMAMKVAGALARITKDYTAKMPGIRVVND